MSNIIQRWWVEATTCGTILSCKRYDASAMIRRSPIFLEDYEHAVTAITARSLTHRYSIGRRR